MGYLQTVQWVRTVGYDTTPIPHDCQGSKNLVIFDRQPIALCLVCLSLLGCESQRLFDLLDFGFDSRDLFDPHNFTRYLALEYYAVQFATSSPCRGYCDLGLLAQVPLRFMGNP